MSSRSVIGRMQDASGPDGREVMHRFGLRADPFSPVHDSRFLMGCKAIRLALGSLRRVLDDGRRLVVVTGEPGVGKTALGDAIVRELRDRVRTARVADPSASWAEIGQEIGAQLHLSGGRLSPGAMVVEPGEQTTLRIVIDHAERLSEDGLRHLSGYMDLQAPPGQAVHMLQVVLLMREASAAPIVAWLAGRPFAPIRLSCLDEQDSRRYVLRRLQLAAGDERTIFANDALEYVVGRSGGLPARINRLCRQALVAATSRGLDLVDLASVREAEERLAGVAGPAPAPAQATAAAQAATAPPLAPSDLVAAAAPPPAPSPPAAAPPPSPAPPPTAAPPAPVGPASAAAPVPAPAPPMNVAAPSPAPAHPAPTAPAPEGPSPPVASPGPAPPAPPPPRAEPVVATQMRLERREPRRRAAPLWGLLLAAALGMAAGSMGWPYLFPGSAEPVTRIVQVPVEVPVKVPVKVPVEVPAPPPETTIVPVEPEPAASPPQLVAVARPVPKPAPAPKPRPKPRPVKPKPVPARVQETVLPVVEPPKPPEPATQPMPSPMEVLKKAFARRRLPDHVAEVEIFEHSGNSTRLVQTLQLARLYQRKRILTLGLLEGPGARSQQRLLSIEAGRSDDERFTYRADTGEVQRIQGNRGVDPFVGTSFRYDDFRPLQVDHFLVHQMARSVLADQSLFILSVKPRFRRDYDRIEFVVNARDYALLETHYYRGKGLRPYRIVQFPRDSMKRFGKALVPERSISRDLVNRTAHEARVVNLQPARDLSAGFFTLSKLKSADLAIPNL